MDRPRGASAQAIDALLRTAWRAKNKKMIVHYTNILLARAARGEVRSEQPPTDG